MANRYAIATDDERATAAAVEAFRLGGNAADAAIAASAMLAVCRPDIAGIGSDASVLVYRRQAGELFGLVVPESAGGRRAPGEEEEASAEPQEALTPGEAPISDVPGLVSLCLELYRAQATLPLDVLFAPAIAAARNGTEVSEALADSTALLASIPATPPDLRKAYLDAGEHAYIFGQTIRQAELAATLGRIADDGRDGIYAAPTEEQSIARMKRDLGMVSDDNEVPEWSSPEGVKLGDCDVYGTSAADYELIDAAVAGREGDQHEGTVAGRVVVGDGDQVIVISQSLGRAWGSLSYDHASGILRSDTNAASQALGGVVAVRGDRLAVAMASPGRNIALVSVICGVGGNVSADGMARIKLVPMNDQAVGFVVGTAGSDIMAVSASRDTGLTANA